MSGPGCSGPNGNDVKYALQNGVVFKGLTVAAPTNDSTNYVIVDFSVPFGAVTTYYGGGVNSKLTVTKGGYCEDITADSSGNVTEGTVYGC